jgi:Caspase domain
MSTQFLSGHALIVGVGGNLPVTVMDAKAIQSVLTNREQAAYPTGQVELLTGGGADRRAILDAFDRLAENVKADPDATVFVYFSGHGGRIEEPGQAPQYFIVPHAYDPARRAETAISGQEFSAKIEAIKARKLLVLLDCCHAAGVPSAKEGAEKFVQSPIPPELLNTLQRGSGRVIIASSYEREYSYTGPEYSVFTACLLEALKGKAAVERDGFARVLDVLIYLFKQVPQRAPGPQHPFLNRASDMGDNFAICYYAGGSKTVPGDEAPPRTEVVRRVGLSVAQRARLETKLKALENRWNLLTGKIEAMRADLIISIMADAKYRYQTLLSADEAERAEVEAEMNRLEEQLV